MSSQWSRDLPWKLPVPRTAGQEVGSTSGRGGPNWESDTTPASDLTPQVASETSELVRVTEVTEQRQWNEYGGDGGDVFHDLSNPLEVTRCVSATATRPDGTTISVKPLLKGKTGREDQWTEIFVAREPTAWGESLIHQVSLIKPRGYRSHWPSYPSPGTFKMSVEASVIASDSTDFSKGASAKTWKGEVNVTGLGEDQTDLEFVSPTSQIQGEEFIDLKGLKLFCESTKGGGNRRKSIVLSGSPVGFGHFAPWNFAGSRTHTYWVPESSLELTETIAPLE